MARQFLAMGKSSFNYARRTARVRGHPPCLESAFISARIRYVATPEPDFRTTFASHFMHSRGIRLVLYDADGDFGQRLRLVERAGIPEPRLPFTNGRTDLLIGSGSRLDIQNINLVATLLAHSEYNGYWCSLGEQFKVEMEQLLERHILMGLLTAPWVRDTWAPIGDDDKFLPHSKSLWPTHTVRLCASSKRRLLFLEHGETFLPGHRMESRRSA